MTDGIFEGLKVIDCASWIAGPAAATILSDFGAEVIKIEPPGAGDPWRASPPVPGKTTDYWWQLTGRNKKSLAIDLKHPEGLAVLLPADRLGRRLHHQLPAAGARAPEDRRRPPAGGQSAADLRLDHGLWRGGQGGGTTAGSTPPPTGRAPA